MSYLVIWTYCANYGTMVVQAHNATLAAEKVRNTFSKDFQENGTCYAMLVDNVTAIGKDAESTKIKIQQGPRF